MTTRTTGIQALSIGTLIFLFTGCAAPLHRSLADEYGAAAVPVRDEMQRCLDEGTGCSVLLIENRNFSDAVIYLNGKRIAEVAALEKSIPVFIPNSQLANKRCAKIEVRLKDFVGRVWQSGTECITPGGHFGLFISDPFSTTTLTGWS